MEDKRLTRRLDLGIKIRESYPTTVTLPFMREQMIRFEQQLTNFACRLEALEEYLIKNKIVNKHEYWKIEIKRMEAWIR